MENTNKELMEKAIKSRAEYQRAWRKKNPNKTKQYNMNYWLKKAKEQLEQEEKGD